jgi:Methyltransferase domain
MVNVRRYQQPGPVLDEEAEVEFVQQWQTYRKLVDNNYVFHREAYATLHGILVDEVAGPFRFLDLACGDAQEIVEMLKTTMVAHYHGVDLSRPALDRAEVALKALTCPVELDQRDFMVAMVDLPEPADVVWIGLSLHHLQPADKLMIMREARGVVGEGGLLVIYEPTCRPDEDRAGYLARFAAVSEPLWRALTAEEWRNIVDHVTRCDFPETAARWLAMGREAGFADAEERFVAPTELYSIFAFRARGRGAVARPKAHSGATLAGVNRAHSMKQLEEAERALSAAASIERAASGASTGAARAALKEAGQGRAAEAA